MASQSKHNRRDVDEDSGDRAEEVAQWYFRLSGFFSIPGFILHSGISARPVITDADLLAVRFPYSREELREIRMNDDRWVQELASNGKTLFVIAEVKAPHCSINRSWTDRTKESMEHVIRRFGFLQDDDAIKEVANAMYDRLRWQNDGFVLQYVCVGSRAVSQLARPYPDLVQINWNDVADFLFVRFNGFGNLKGSHRQWGRFGRQYARGFLRGEIRDTQESRRVVDRYITEGRMDETKQQVNDGGGE